ncbi:MAG TPA: hypothetical protein VFY87_18560, partial [Geminicoccaceae bacterium]|nr:hypothetical protein [Geminicoccaceae bacterium]
GRIRFRRRWAPRAWLAAVHRGERPAGGIVAAERAAWPPLEAVPAARPSGNRRPQSAAGTARS